MDIMGPAGMEDMAEQLRGMFSQMAQDKRADAQAARSARP